MTKEELEKESEEFLRCTVCGDNCHDICEEPCHRADGVKKHFLASVEPREKHIEELIALINAERERQEKCDDVHLRKIADLEKENTELKKQLEMSNKVYNDNLDYSHHIEEHLTKAKELLAKWVELFKPKCGNIPPTPIQVDTEQFLSEVEK